VHDGVALADEFEKYILKKEKPEIHKKAIGLVLKMKEKTKRIRYL